MVKHKTSFFYFKS